MKYKRKDLELLTYLAERKALIEQTITDEKKAAALKLIKDNYDAYIRSNDEAIAEKELKLKEELKELNYKQQTKQ